MSTPAAKPRRIWYRYRLATLVSLMLLVALSLAFVGSVLRERRRQEQLAQYFRDRGSVTQTKSGGFWAPRVVRLQHSEGMGPGVMPLTADDVARLNEFPHLRALYFEGQVLTADAVATLGTLIRIEQLGLAHMPLADEQLLALRDMKSLRQLDLVNTGVTEQALAELCRALPRLEVADD